MGGCCGEAIPSCEVVFDERTAADDLRALRTKGAPWATRELIAQVSAEIDASGLTVLDVGAGVGAVHLSLLERGAARAVDVDGSSAYLAAAREEAGRRGLGDRVEHVLGDLTAVGATLAPADLVTLDRVVCCYGDLDGLLATASALARRRLGLVYPKDTWWVRTGAAVANAVAFRRCAGYRMRIHRRELIEERLATAGFRRRSEREGRLWRVETWERAALLS